MYTMWRFGHDSVFSQDNNVVVFYVHGSVHRESMSIIVQRDATIYSFIIFLQSALHVSDDTLIHHQEHTQNCNYKIWRWSKSIATVR